MTTISIDNNFFNHFDRLPIKRKAKIFNLIKNNEIVLCLTDVLLVELLGLIKGSQNSKIVNHCKILQEMHNYRLFSSYVQIFKRELCDITDCIYASIADEQKIRNLISQIAFSGMVSKRSRENILNILKKSKQYIEDWKKVEERNLSNARKRMKQKLSKNSSITKAHVKDFLKKGFEYYYSLKSQEKLDFAYKFLKTNGVDVSQKKLKKIIDMDGYPYINTWLRCRFGLYYTYFKNHYSILKANDLHDVTYLFYMPDIDYLISNDNLVRKIGDVVFSKSKVLCFDSFLSLISC